MTLGEVIKFLLNKKGLTQAELSEKIGKSKTAVSQIINGAYSPNPETLQNISKILEVPVPVIYFLSISEKDIPEDKKQLYDLLSPLIQKYLFEIFSVEN